MYRRLLSNTVLFSVSTFGSKILLFLLTPFYTSILTDAEYGVTDLIIQTGNVLIPLVSMGIINAVLRFGLDETTDLKGLFTTGLVVILVGEGVLALCYPLLQSIGLLSDYVLLLLLYVLMANLHAVFGAMAQAMGKVRLYAGSGILCTALVVAMNLLLLSVFRLGIVGYVLSNVIADGVVALVLFGMGFSSLVGGNAFLSIYLLGILMGNSSIRNKKEIIPFFDGVTGLSQIVIFFLLGLLSFPHKFPYIMGTAIVIALFILLIARPLTVLLILKPFHCSLNQCLLVSWAGLRGASSIVFSIFAMAAGNDISRDLFHIVFMISLLSVAVQGTLLPYVSRKLDMIDDKADVQKTFNDYQEESAITLMRMYIPKGHNWENKHISEVHMPTGALALMIKRDDETIITRGNTQILAGDSLILSVPTYNPDDDEGLEEIFIDKNHPWGNQRIEDLNLPENVLIALIKRNERNIIPDGKTFIEPEDIVVLYK